MPCLAGLGGTDGFDLKVFCELRPGTFSQTYGSILTVILHINDVPCCWNQSEARDYCRAHYYDLASIHNVQENDAVLLACMDAGASALVGDWVDQVRLTGTFSPATHFLIQI